MFCLLTYVLLMCLRMCNYIELFSQLFVYYFLISIYIYILIELFLLDCNEGPPPSPATEWLPFWFLFATTNKQRYSQTKD